MKLSRPLLLLLGLALSPLSSAKVVQILHTNDLHSYFQGTRGGIGGYAQLKKVVDELKTDAESKGIPTLYLDGGDFGEGSSFYFSNHGTDSMKALDRLGVDYTVLGNHDYILGTKELKNQIKKSKIKAKILSSNIVGKSLMGLSKLVPDYVDHEIDGLKIRIFGLTTNEIHHMYPLRPLGFVTNPHKAGIKQATKARKDNVDFTIALTHIGLQYDIQLIEKSRTIDLVVGGHSHILLPRPQLTKNLEGRLIPILQAGAHSGYIGSMIVDIKGKGEAELIDYKMIDIKKDMPQDESMKDFVASAYSNREKYFGRKWDEVIGFSNIKLTGNLNGKDTPAGSCWSRHMARLTRKVAKTDLGLQFDVFQGEQIDPGTITFGDMIDNFPHIRKWGDKGWSVARSTMSGFLLKQVLKLLANSEVALQVMIDGISVKDKITGSIKFFDPKIHNIQEALINGEELQNLRYYTVGLPSEVPYGMLKLLNVLTSVLLHDLKLVPNSEYWNLLETYIKKNSPIRCLED